MGNSKVANNNNVGVGVGWVPKSGWPNLIQQIRDLGGAVSGS